MEANMDDGKGLGTGAASSSSSALPPGSASSSAEATFDLDGVVDNACRCLSLERRIGPGLYAFADAASPLCNKFIIHKLRRGNAETLRATCVNRGHGKCMLWISMDCAEPFNFRRVLLALMLWGADGRDDSEQAHHTRGVDAKRLFGMRV
jgi:hypothetical protein